MTKQSEWTTIQQLTRGLDKVVKAQAFTLMREVGFEAAQAYLETEHAEAIKRQSADQLLAQPLPYQVWGQENIEAGALAQMDLAMRLPVTVAGALMPDAHQGYGLPIGGVLATDNVVIPWAVGVDIACRMRLSVFNVVGNYIDREHDHLVDILKSVTQFGAGADGIHDGLIQHPVLEEDAWNATPLLRGLRETARRQLGTSGGGNHFADICEIESVPNGASLTFGGGRWLALMTHSGSRGVGARIADHYSRLATSEHPNLEGEAAKLAWLDMDGLGAEYWHAMELAGRFAAVNHQVIHERFAAALGFEPRSVVENHHNFAWRETFTLDDGTQRQLIVHRKGATPAGFGVWGIIPGSMATPGYVVTGKGVSRNFNGMTIYGNNLASLDSASHGSGRTMSRTKAKANIDPLDVKKQLKAAGVTLLGGGLDEAPQAYKNSADVMAAQAGLVNVQAVLYPRIVIMADDTRVARSVPAGIFDGSND